MNASIRLHLISGAGQHGSAVALRRDPDMLDGAIGWVMHCAASLNVTPTLVVMHGEARVLLTLPVNVPTTTDGRARLGDAILTMVSGAWDRAEDTSR